MEKLARISARLDHFNLKLGQASAWLSIPIIFIIMLDVISRRFFALGSVTLQELEWHFHAVLFLFCAGYTYLQDGHVRVDIFRARFSDRIKAWIELVGCVVFLIPFCMAIFILGLRFVADSYALGEISDAPGGLPFRYVIKSVIPLAFFFLMGQGISIALKQIVFLFGSPRAGRGDS